MKTHNIGHDNKNRYYFTHLKDAYNWLTQLGFIVVFEPEIKEKKLKQA